MMIRVTKSCASLSIFLCLFTFCASYADAAQAERPTSITVPTGDADGAYTVSWGASATAGVTYVLQEATNNTFTAGLRTAYSGKVLNAQISSRTSGKVYYYRVMAKKTGYTNSAWRTGTHGCAVPGTKVGRPTSIMVPPNDADGSYTVRWGASATAGVKYVLQEATDETFTTGLRTVYTGTALTSPITGRTPETVYYYRVMAKRTGYTNSAWLKGPNGSLDYARAMIVGAWEYGGRFCATQPNPMAVPGYFLCPSGGLRGFEQFYLDGKVYEYLALGSYSISQYSTVSGAEQFADVDLDYTTTICTDGVCDDGPGVLGNYMFYDHDNDRIVFYYNSCWFALERLVDGGNTDVDDSYCDSSVTNKKCGTDCDCGRCWYCDKSGSSNVCRYGGEGPFACYRGCQF